jgi:hypothetical protein
MRAKNVDEIDVFLNECEWGHVVWDATYDPVSTANEVLLYKVTSLYQLGQ